MSIALPRRAADLHARKDPAVDPLMMRQGVATRANAVFMVLLFNALLAPPAFACKPLVPEWQVREFLATKPAGGALAGDMPADGSESGAGGRGGSEAEAPRRDVNMSTAIKPTPTQMAMSATLKVGQWLVTDQPLTTLATKRFMSSIHFAW